MDKRSSSAKGSAKQPGAAPPKKSSPEKDGKKDKEKKAKKRSGTAGKESTPVKGGSAMSGPSTSKPVAVAAVSATQTQPVASLSPKLSSHSGSTGSPVLTSQRPSTASSPSPSAVPARSSTVSTMALKKTISQSSSVPAARRTFEKEMAERQVHCDIFTVDTLTRFFVERTFCDLKLIGPDGTEHHVHRIVAAAGSKWIFKELNSSPREGPWSLKVPFEDPAGIFERIVKWLYTGQIEIADHATAVNNLARAMEIPSLIKQVAQYLASTVQRHNCVAMLKQAIALKAVDVEDACIQVVARNFSLLDEKDWTWLKYESFLSLLRAEYFQAKSERDVLDLIRTYCATHTNLSKDQRRALLQETRFRFLSLAEMQEVARDGAFEVTDLLLEGALARLEAFEKPNSAGHTLVGTKEQLKKRKKHGIQFPYTPELEMKGIIYYLATNGGKVEYENPHLLGVVTVSASSLERGIMLDLVSAVPSELWTKPVPASWFCVDFKTRRVRPHHYSLRHGGLHCTDFLRYWDLQGSNDGERWILLRKHTADSSLSKPFGVCSWEIPQSHRSFRYFRVIQTGHNSSRHNFLALSGIEFYGEIREGNVDDDDEGA